MTKGYAAATPGGSLELIEYDLGPLGSAPDLMQNWVQDLNAFASPTSTQIPTISPTPSVTSTPAATPNIPEFPYLAILPLVLTMLFGVIITGIKRVKPRIFNEQLRCNCG